MSRVIYGFGEGAVQSGAANAPEGEAGSPNLPDNKGRPVKRHASGDPFERIRRIVLSSLEGPTRPYDALEQIDALLAQKP